MHQNRLRSLLTKQLPGLHSQTLWYSGSAVGLKPGSLISSKLMLKLPICSPHMGKDWSKQPWRRELLDPAKYLITCVLCDPYHLDTAGSSHSCSMLGSIVHPKRPQVLRASTRVTGSQEMGNPGPLPNPLTRFALSKLPSHALPESQPPPQRCGILSSSNLPGPESRGAQEFQGLAKK